MDSSFYKSLTTRRSLKYSYYISTPTTDKPFLVFVHGFPGSSKDWKYQVAFFKDLGYGIIALDALGYGGTDKPTDYVQYSLREMSRDLIEILDAEKVNKAIAVGHDWGSALVSRLANYFPERFIGYAFLSVGYFPPSTVPFPEFLAFTKTLVGYELFGYWYFFAEPDAHKTIEKNFDAFYSLLYAEDPSIWVEHMAFPGAWKAWIQADKRTPISTFLTEEEVNQSKKEILENGLEAPLCWYKANVHGLDTDTKDLAPERYILDQPIFFGATTRDPVCHPLLGKGALEHFTKGTNTVKDYDTSHFVMWQEKDKLNQDLLDWINTL